jgi:hypothetical protein
VHTPEAVELGPLAAVFEVCVGFDIDPAEEPGIVATRGTGVADAAHLEAEILGCEGVSRIRFEFSCGPVPDLVVVQANALAFDMLSSSG